MHIAAPLRVEYRVLAEVFCAVAYCDGSRVSEKHVVVGGVGHSAGQSRAWASAFLDGVRNAPLVAGVRS